MTPKQEAAMRQALGVLRQCLDHPDADDAITALREALAEQAQKPTDADLLAARAYADQRWNGEDVPIYWLRHFVDGLGRQAAQQAAEPVACTYGDGGYACCEGGPCAADVHNASLSDRHMDAIKPFTADVMRIIRDAGMTFHLGLPHDKVIEQMTRVVDLAYAEASIKAAVVFSAPTQQPLTELSPEFTDTARAALLWVLWHHQGGSSPVGQPIRFALGMGAHDRLTDQQIREAKRWASLDPKPAHGTTGSKEGGAA